MEAAELARKLRETYEQAKRNEATCQVILYGIRFAKDLQQCKEPLKNIVEQSGISKGYLAEIWKGIKLSQYVEIKEGK